MPLATTAEERRAFEHELVSADALGRASSAERGGWTVAEGTGADAMLARVRPPPKDRMNAASSPLRPSTDAVRGASGSSSQGGGPHATPTRPTSARPWTPDIKPQLPAWDNVSKHPGRIAAQTVGDKQPPARGMLPRMSTSFGEGTASPSTRPGTAPLRMTSGTGNVPSTHAQHLADVLGSTSSTSSNSTGVSSCRLSRAKDLAATHNKELLAGEWNSMMASLHPSRPGLFISGESDAYTLACAILLVKEGLLQPQEGQGPVFCHCCDKAQHQDAVLNMSLLDGLLGGAVGRLKQRNKSSIAAPADLEYHGLTDSDRIALIRSIYGASNKASPRKRSSMPRQSAVVLQQQCGTQTDTQVGKNVSTQVRRKCRDSPTQTEEVAAAALVLQQPQETVAAQQPASVADPAVAVATQTSLWQRQAEDSKKQAGERPGKGAARMPRAEAEPAGVVGKVAGAAGPMSPKRPARAKGKAAATSSEPHMAPFAASDCSIAISLSALPSAELPTAQAVASSSGPEPSRVWTQFPGVHSERLAAFAGIASKSLRTMLDLALSMKAELGSDGRHATALSAAATASSTASTSETMARSAIAVEADGQQQAIAVASELSACVEQGQRLFGRQHLQGGVWEETSATSALLDGPAAAPGPAEAVAALWAAQHNLCRLGLEQSGSLHQGTSGSTFALALMPGTALGAPEAEDPLAASGLPSLTPLLQQLQVAGTHLVRSLATAVIMFLGANVVQPGASISSYLADAEAAAAAVQRLLRVLADNASIARRMLSNQTPAGPSLPTLPLVCELSTVAEARYSAFQAFALPAMQCLKALPRTWVLSGTGEVEQREQAMGFVRQLYEHIHTFSQDLITGLGLTSVAQDKGARALSLHETVSSSILTTAAASAAAALQTLTGVSNQLYAQRAGADAAVHAATLSLVLQGHTLNLGILMDGWSTLYSSAWNVARAHVLRESRERASSASLGEKLAPDTLQLTASLSMAEAKIKALQDDLQAANQQREDMAEAASRQREEMVQVATKKLEEALAAVVKEKDGQLQAALKQKEEELQQVSRNGDKVQDALQDALSRLQVAEAVVAEASAGVERRLGRAGAAAFKLLVAQLHRRSQKSAVAPSKDQHSDAEELDADAAAAALSEIARLQQELDDKTTALEAAEKSLQETCNSLQVSAKALQELAARAPDADLEAEQKLVDLEEQLQQSRAECKEVTSYLQEATQGWQEAKTKLEVSKGVVEDLRKRLRARDESLQELDGMRAKVAELEAQRQAKPVPPVIEKRRLW